MKRNPFPQWFFPSDDSGASDAAESDLKAGILREIVRARRDRGISQKRLEQLSGVRQPVIARLEGSSTDPRLTTLLRILRALGKKLVIEDI